MAIASESTHWYDKAGQPRYTVIGANGNERPTTLRDARKDGLVPSVTTVMSVAAKPGLEAWKLNQAFLSALTLPPSKSGQSWTAGNTPGHRLNLAQQYMPAWKDSIGATSIRWPTPPW